MPTIEFIGHANHHSRGYLPGQRLFVDEATAQAYIDVHQARLVDAVAAGRGQPSPAADTATSLEGRGEEQKKRVIRRGKLAETAELPPGEQR